MVKCPYCSYEGEFKFGKSWKFRFYDVKRIECPNSMVYLTIIRV